MFGIKLKKSLLSLHILLIAIWFGTLVSILFFQMIKHSDLLSAKLSIVDQLIFMLSDYIILNISIAVAISGLIFSMFTSWGFFRFRWIVFKWVMIVLIAFCLMFLAGPAVNGMAALSDIVGNDAALHSDYLSFEHEVMAYSLLQLVALIIVILVSVFKPWGTREQKFKLKRGTVLVTGSVTGLLLVLSLFTQYMQLREYRQLPVKAIDLTRLNDGIYPGSADYGFDYQVQVEIKDHKITRIKIVKNRDSFYARLAEGITKKIIREQKTNTDAVTGATTTSKILMKSVEAALSAGK